MKNIFEKTAAVICILSVVWFLGSPQEISGKDMLGGCTYCSIQGDNYPCGGMVCFGGCNLCNTGTGHCGLPGDIDCVRWGCNSRCTNVDCS